VHWSGRLLATFRTFNFLEFEVLQLGIKQQSFKEVCSVTPAEGEHLILL
jgi:hypothetical protein